MYSRLDRYLIASIEYHSAKCAVIKDAYALILEEATCFIYPAHVIIVKNREDQDGRIEFVETVLTETLKFLESNRDWILEHTHYSSFYPIYYPRLRKDIKVDTATGKRID